jgi:hypothetical protein
MIQNKAMLVSLSISSWAARKQDKRVTAEVETTHGAHNSGTFNKALVNKGLLEPVNKVTAEARKMHHFYTQPWTDDGRRILSSKNFMLCTGDIRKIKGDFDSAVNTLLAQYPAEVQAARNRLGTMYDPGDYPDPADIASKFSFELKFEPIPDGHDFRVDLSTEALTELRQSVTHDVVLRQAKAMESCYSRLREVVSKVEERLSIPDAIFKDSLIQNVKDECSIMDGLNITDDAVLTSLVSQIQDQLIVPPSTLRNSPFTRARVANAAAALLQQIP